MAKWHLFWVAIFIIGVFAVVYAPRCSRGSDSSAALPLPTFDKTRSWADLEYQVNAGYRIPGTATHRKIHEWLETELGKSAIVTAQPFSHHLGGQDVQMWNIIATIPGTGQGTHERVLLAAHWDSRPIADKDPLPANRSLPIAAANDGASGVAVLLEVARQLKLHPIARDVTIVLFDGEDYGPDIDNMLLGARFYAGHLPTVKPSWGILLDMIGDKDLNIYREPNSDMFAKTVNDRVFQTARLLGYQTKPGGVGFINEPYRYLIDDDHIPLNHAGIPTVDLIDFDYTPWHTRNDTADKCSADSLAMVGNTVLYALQLN